MLFSGFDLILALSALRTKTEYSVIGAFAAVAV